ncbi:MAG: hypothetical protein WCC66_03485, partial [Rhizobiaceae bacterium]
MFGRFSEMLLYRKLSATGEGIEADQRLTEGDTPIVPSEATGSVFAAESSILRALRAGAAALFYASAAATTLFSNAAYSDPADNPVNFSRTTAGAIATTVPDGVCGFTSVAVGGGGGSSSAAAGTGGQGGGAASISATFKALPLQAVTGAVASGGLAGATPTGGTGTQSGGTGGAITSATIHRGSGGGGSTSLSIGGVQLIVAGGGGGGGAAHGNTPNSNGGNAGAAGITAGVAAPGVNGSIGANTTAVGGVLGTVGGGQGGQAAAGGTGGVNSINATENGFAGTAAGAGGNGGVDTGTDSAGGGGAGFTGGGGGASTNGDTSMGGGGGGGSSFVRSTSPTVQATAAASVSGNAMPSIGVGALPGATGSMSLTWVPCLYTLNVAKSVSSPAVNAGGRVVWTVSVTNTGPDPMTRGDTLTLADTLPVGPNGAPTPAFRVLSVGTSGGSNADLESGAVTCTGLSVGAAMPSSTTCTRPYSALSAPGAPSGGTRGLNSGETLTITYEQIISNTAACSTITNTATAVDRTAAGSTTTRTANAPLSINCYDLAVTKSVSPTAPASGQVLTWTVAVTNNGAADMQGPDDTAANPLIITDAAPATNVSAPTSFTSTGPAGACAYAGGTITCPSGLASGSTQTFTFQQTVSPTAVSGAVIANTAIVTDFRTGDSNDSALASATVPPTTIAITKISNGGVGAFTFNGNNGFGAAQTITTVTPGTAVTGTPRTLAAAATATTITETIPSGYVLASASCTGMGTGGTATPNLAAGTLALNAAATAAGSSIACTFTNTKTPTVKVQKSTVGAFGGPFAFTQTNLASAPADVTTTAVTTPAPASPAAINVSAIGADVTLTETPVAGYLLASAVCTDANSAITGNSGSIGTLTGNVLTIPPVNVKAGSDYTCLFTNAKLPTITLTKISNGGIGAFTFNGDNGFGAAQTITTVTSGTGVAGSSRTLAAAATATTITETIPAGYALTSATCTGMGAGGTATPNLATGALLLDSAATAAGSAIACTFTNGKLPTINLTKVSNGGAGAFSFSGNNGFSNQTITTTASGAAVSSAVQTLAAVSTITTITEAIPAGYTLTSITCTGTGTGNTTNNLAAGSVQINALGTAPGKVINCIFTNTKFPTITLTKVSNGDVGAFAFNGDNGFGAAQTITTLTPGTGVSGSARTLAAAATATTITESVPAGYALASAACTGLGAGGGATPNLSTGALTLDAAATAAGSNIACTFTNAKLPTITLSKVSNGGAGAFTFNGDNGFGAAQTITTVTSGTGVSGAARTLATAAAATTITESVPAGYALASAACTGMGAGGTATPNLATGALALNAAATAPGSNISCTFTNSKLPVIQLTKVSNGGAGAFTFNGDNGFGAAQTITTVTSGTGISGAARTLAAAGTATAITESIPAGYALASASCTGMGAGGTATPNLATGALALDSAATAAGSNIACTFTNTKLPTVRLTKISNGGAGAFSFTGDNGFVSDTITTISSGSGVQGALKTLTAASTPTTITESVPAGYALVSATCTGLGSGGTATPNLATGTLVLDSAATAAGSNIACTFTNAKLPTIQLTKISNGGVGGFTFNGDNGFGAAQIITTVTSGTGVSGAIRPLTAPGAATSVTESIPAGYTLTSASCTGMAAGGTATPNLATGTVVLDPAATAAGSAIACTFTNAKLPTVTLTKISNGSVGAFSFTGDNGLTSQTITTSSSGAGVTGAAQTLASAATSTTITEAIPSGFALTSATCTGMGTGGTATPNLATGALVLDSAATAAGSNIACSFTNGVPKFTIAKSVDLASVSAPGTVNYQVTVTNNGAVSLTSPSLTDSLTQGGSARTLASGPTLVSGDLAPVGVFDIGETWTYQASYAVTQADIDNGAALSNTATFDTDQTVPIASNAATTSIVQGRSMSVAKTAVTVNFLNIGDLVSYEYLVTNTGNVTLTDPVTVSDNRVTPVNCPALPLGGLAPGATLTCTADYHLVLEDLDIGSVTNLASATSGPTTSPQTSETVPSGATPALTIGKSSATADFNNVGDTIAYSFLVTNSGNATLTRTINVTDNKIGAIACFTPTGADPTFMPSETVTCTANYTVTQADLDAGFVTNQAFASTTYGAANIPVTSPPDSLTVNAVQNPQLTVAKSAGALPITAVGQVLTYTINIDNTGDVTLSTINVSDPLIPSLSCTIASLAPGVADSSCTGTYTVTQADFDAGAIVNTASASGLTPQGAPVSDTGGLSTPITQISSMELLKGVTFNDENGDGHAQIGETLSYQFTVSNSGNTTLTNIAVTDPSVTILGGPLTSLAVGASDSFTFTAAYALTATDLAAGSHQNQAFGSADTPLAGPISDTSDSTNPADETGGGSDPTTILLSAAPVVATGDTPPSVNGATGNPSVVNAFANDTLNGVAVVPGAITATVLTPAANPGVVLDPATGIVSVAAGTPAGLYTITYQICEALNPANCAVAVATVDVIAAPVVAADDAGTVNGLTGGTVPGLNALGNDTLNGLAIAPADVTLVPVTAGPLTVNADGSVTVAPNTPAGPYTVAYQVCEVLNPANCDTADVVITVDAAPMAALDDAGSSTPLGGTVPGLNVLANDTLNGVAMVPADVTITPVTTGPLTVNADGTVTVAPGTPAGPYTVSYTVCEVLNPANCDTADVIITVNAGNIAADADAVSGVNGLTGAADVLDVLAGDTLNGSPATLSTVNLSVVTPAANPGVTLDPATGLVSVAAGTPAGLYTITYQICEALNPANCAVAVATVDVIAAPVVAADDAGSSTPLGGTVPGLNVLANDTLNGVAMVPADVTITPVTTGPLTVNADGTVTVAPGTPAGPYTVSYTVCEVLNP